MDNLKAPTARGQGRHFPTILSPALLILLPLAFIAIFFLYPIVSIVRLSLAPHGTFDPRSLAQLFTSSYYVRTLWFTLWQALVSTGLTLAVGIPAAFVFARYKFPGKTLLRALSTIPFVLPTIVVAAAFSSFVGSNGVVNLGLMSLLHLSDPPIQLVGTVWIILLAHVFYNYTIVLRIVSALWANLDPSLENAAAVLGANRLQGFLSVTLPLLTPAIAAAALLVFIFDFTSFGVVLILGGSQFATLEVEIYRQTENVFNLPVAAALSLVQIGFTLGLTVVYTRLQARTSRPLNLRPQGFAQRRPVTRGARAFVIANISVTGILLIAPLLALIGRTVAGGLQPFTELFVNRRGSYFYVPPATAIRNSLLVSGVTIVAALTLGLIAASILARAGDRTGTHRLQWQSILDPLFMLPLGTSAVTLGFGYIISMDRPPLDLRASPLLLPLAHTLVAFPFVVRSLLPVLRGIRPSLRGAASILGASPMRVWREIDVAIVSRALLVAAAFAFSISMGEFGATALVARPEFPTMPVVIYRFLGLPGALNYEQALAMSTLLMLVCSVGIILIECVRVGDLGEF